MQWLDLTLPSPAANLALDEALLDACELSRARECLRFWEPTSPFVVIGYGQRLQREVHAARCKEEGVPVLRRCSGGGAVLQAQGCLNYSLVLSLHHRPDLESVTRSNCVIMRAHRDALSQLLGEPITVEGHTDLAWQGLKVSGNSQRRRRHSMLFHGTFLLTGFPLETVGRYLPFPSQEPAYRRQRRHEDFLARLPLPAKEIKHGLRSAWKASAHGMESWPDAEVTDLVGTRYGNPDWVERM